MRKRRFCGGVPVIVTDVTSQKQIKTVAVMVIPSWMHVILLIYYLDKLDNCLDI
ncbi:hypothetical protein [Methanosarcina barkeri]|uniref:hypothetical protein n=1 Tax=Methanosarcina barkeri TaxID=2208 RepID=UPI00003C6266|nr:hypothetical protein [Methanosarcina barkeri]